MINLGERIFKVYAGIMGVFFYVFLFCTLAFGRSFSIIHISMPFFPLFVTEIFLLLNIPLLFYKSSNLTRLPKIFLVFFLTFFGVSLLYLLFGLLKLNIFALRDITLFGYLLFLPITFINLNSLNKIKLLIVVIFLSNIFNLFLGWGLFLKAYPLGAFYNLISETRIFNVGLYYAIAISFIVSFYECIKPRIGRLFALIILSLNVFIIIASVMSSLWVAILMLFVFLFILLRARFLKLLCLFIPVFIALSILYPRPSIRESVFNESKGFSSIIQGLPAQNQPMKTLSEVKTTSASMFRQDKPTQAPPKAKTAPACKLRQAKSAHKSADLHAIPGNIAWRFGIWKQTLKFASDSLLIGKGFGVYPVYEIWTTHQYPHGIYMDSGIVPVHNHIITVLFKMGILGLGLFLFINIYVFFYALFYINKCNLRFFNQLLVALLGAFVSWHTLAFLFDVIDSPPTSIFLWIIIGSIFAALGIDKNSLSEIRKEGDKANV